MKPGKTLPRVAVVASAALAIGSAAVASAAGPRGTDHRLPAPAGVGGDFAPGEAIVRFEPGASATERQDARRAAGASFEEAIGLPRAHVVEVEGSVSAAVRRLERQPGVAYAQPNYRYEATAVGEPDTFFEELWGLGEPVGPEAGVYALEAWEQTRGDEQVIAVLDTGVDLTHPDIAPNLWEDLSGDHGHDFVDDDADPDDFNYHGTHVAGTAAAAADNAEGIAGVAPEAEIMAVRVLDGDGSGFTDEIADGIGYAAENDADVINMSLGGPADGGDEAMSDAIAEAGEAGVVTVVAAGNEGADNDSEPHTPCALSNPTMICVAALNKAGALAGFSNYGRSTVDVAAPGGGDIPGGGILSAKTDYGEPLFEDDFEGGLGQWTTDEAFNGAKSWGESDSAASGLKSATDSPEGLYGHPPRESEEFAESDLLGASPLDLTGKRGCRMHFRTRYEVESFFDIFFAGASTSAAPLFDESDFEFEADGVELDGFSAAFPSFGKEEASISEYDGETGVRPVFSVVSDELFELDGAHVDDVRLICRDGTYVDAIAAGSNYDQPESGNYIRFQGTSMATPHVSGVVALVRAAAPSLSAPQIIDAVLDGSSAMPNPEFGRATATFGIADACKAIAVATEANVGASCPASSAPETPEPPDDEEDEGGGDSSSGDAPPLAPVVQPPPAVDRVPPQTFIRRHPRKLIRTRFRRGRAVFVFRASERGALFLCQFDRKRRRRCGPRFVRWFRPGSHVLRATTRDAAGNVDPTPAVYRFRVKRVGK